MESMQRPSRPIIWFFFRFKGRVGRKGFWAYSLTAMLLMGFAFYVVLMATFGGRLRSGLDAAEAMLIGLIVLFALQVLLAWTSCAVVAKRWHDRGRSGWWSLIIVMPYLALPLDFAASGVEIVLELAFALGGLWTLVECGFLKGTKGPNRYGDDPQGLRPEMVAEVFD